MSFNPFPSEGSILLVMPPFKFPVPFPHFVHVKCKVNEWGEASFGLD